MVKKKKKKKNYFFRKKIFIESNLFIYFFFFGTVYRNKFKLIYFNNSAACYGKLKTVTELGISQFQLTIRDGMILSCSITDGDGYHSMTDQTSR